MKSSPDGLNRVVSQWPVTGAAVALLPLRCFTSASTHIDAVIQRMIYFMGHSGYDTIPGQPVLANASARSVGFCGTGFR